MKIKLTEFWDSKQALAIHCDTQEKAKTLLKAFDKLGKKWVDGDSYLGDTYYNYFGRITCYTNTGIIGRYNTFKISYYTIYEFDEVDLDK